MDISLTPFCFAASSVTWAHVRASAATLEVVAQARHDVVSPAATAHIEALQFPAQSVLAEVELGRVAIDRGNGERGPGPDPVGKEGAVGDGPPHRHRPGRLVDVDHERFGGVHDEPELAAGLA